jgi:DNA-binding NtrC family response regulator
MPGQRPTLVASDAPVADQIQTYLQEQLGQLVFRCPYDACRKHMAWHKEGLVVLVAADEADAAAAARVVQEAHILRSPLSVVVVQAGAPDEALVPLAPFVAGRLAWPQAAGRLAGLVRNAAAGGPAEESLADAFVGRLLRYTPSLLPQVQRLALAAVHDVTVLLTGETGTGKTYLARLLHEHSPRRHSPFLMVPCGAQPANLFASTFFGHIKGAFTGAHQGAAGKFAAAGRGTILLDEIDTLGLEQQASLLRVIETGEYEPVGSNETRRSEARLIVASNWNLEESVEKGLFRQDLFYRLNVMAFHLPPLRERRQDIPLLARAFVAHFNAKFGKGLYDIAPDALAAIEAYHWPGNLRQLENALQQAVLVSHGPELALHDLPESIARPCGRPVAGPALAHPFTGGAGVADATDFSRAVAAGTGRPNGDTLLPGDTLLRNRSAYEQNLIRQTLERCKYNRSSTARVLGISRVTLYKKIKQYGLTDLPPH